MPALLNLLSRREILITLVAGIIGAGVMYFYHLNQLRENQKNTALLISSFQDTYETQKGITESYEAILHKLSYCSVTPEDVSCSFDEIFTLAKDSTDVRNNLVDRLNKLNDETEIIMAKF